MNSVLRSLVKQVLRHYKSNAFVRNFSIYAFGRLIGTVASLILLPLFTRKLSQSEFGIIGILWLFIPLTARMINLGIDVALSLKFFKLPFDQFCSYLYNALAMVTLMGIVVILSGCYYIQWIGKILDPSIDRFVFTLLICSIVFSIYASMMNGILQLLGKAGYSVLFSTCQPLILAIVTFLIIVYVKANCFAYIMGIAVGNCVIGTLGLCFFFSKYPIKHFRPSLVIQKELLRVGLPIVPSTVGVIALASSDRYIIKEFLGLESVAIYTFGYRIAEYTALSLFEPFQKALTPIILQKAAREFSAGSELNFKMLRIMLCFLPFVIAAAIIPSRTIMICLGGSAYVKSYPIFLISIFGILLYTVWQASNVLLNHLERTDIVMIATIFGAGLNIGLNIWLLPKYGIVTAALTTILCYAFMFIAAIMVLNVICDQGYSLVKLLCGFLPFGFYICIIYYLDIRTNLGDITKYTYKIVAYGILLVSHYFIFPEFKKMIGSMLCLPFRSFFNRS